MTTVLVTRPQPDADRTTALLRQQGHTVLADPLFTVEFARTPPAKSSYQALLVTSRNAIRALVRCNGVDPIKTLPLFAVGQETGEEAARAGFVSIIVADGDAGSLVRKIREHRRAREGPLLYLAGHVRKPMLEDMLAADGYALDVWQGYDMKPSPALRRETETALRQKTVDVVLLFSEQAALHFLKLMAACDAEILKAPVYICLSEQIAAPLQQKALRTVTAASPDLHAMNELLTHKNH